MSSFLTFVGVLLTMAYFWPNDQGKASTVTSTVSSVSSGAPRRKRKRRR